MTLKTGDLPSRRRFRLTVATAVLCGAALLVPAQAGAWVVNTAARTPEMIRDKWQTDKPIYNGTPYSVTPSYNYPYRAGSLRYEYVRDGVRFANFARYLAGVPDDLVADNNLNYINQHAAVVNAANGQLDHTPSRPWGMSQAFWSLGYEGCGSSNLAYGVGSLEEAVRLYLDDSDRSNISDLGHRRWVLTPQMRKTGMGTAGLFSAMWVMDASRSETGTYDAISWPCAGPFPVELINGSYDFRGVAWSAQLNPEKYTVEPSGVTVTMRRARDGRTWYFDQGDVLTNYTFEYSRICVADSSGFVLFRPEPGLTYSVGDQFDVTIGGSVLLADTGTRTTVHYRTTFMSLKPPPARIGLAEAPSPLTFSETARFRIALTDSTGKPLAYKNVALDYSLDGGRTWRWIRTVSTNASGNASTRWTPTKTAPATRVRARFPGDSKASGCFRSVIIYVRPRLSIAAPSSASAGQTTQVYGYVLPRHAVGSTAGSVQAYRYESGAWVYRAGFPAKIAYNSDTASRFKSSVRLGRGVWRLRLYHPADAAHVAASSSYVQVTVR